MPLVAGNSTANPCGMLKFNAKSDAMSIAYTASHPLSLATYSFWIVRGANTINSSSGTANPVPRTFSDTVGNMLGTCPSAAFSVGVYVYAMAINGYSRQSQYDASSVIAFALTQ
jgi:hypothetical protein